MASDAATSVAEQARGVARFGQPDRAPRRPRPRRRAARRHSAGSPVRSLPPRARAGPGSARGAAARSPTPGPISKPSVPLALASSDAVNATIRAFSSPARAPAASICSSAARTSGRAASAVSQQSGPGAQLSAADGRRLDEREALGACGSSPSSVRSRARARSRAVTRVRRAGLEAQRVGARETCLEFADVAHAQLPFGELRGLRARRPPARPRASAAGRTTSTSKNARRTSAIRRSPLATSCSAPASAFSRASSTRFGRCQSCIDRDTSAVNSSCFGPHGKSSDKIGFLSRPASIEIGAREAERRERDLKVGVVPERDRDRLVEGQAVVERDARRGGPLADGRRQSVRVDARAFGEPVCNVRAVRRFGQGTGGHCHHRQGQGSLGERLYGACLVLDQKDSHAGLSVWEAAAPRGLP